ncbi:MAG: hypothetical protein JNG84_00925 [Archangium sp.]|nr:hypothetical protein [Archangium sp.]
MALSGPGLEPVTSVRLGLQPAVIVRRSASALAVLVMPGSETGAFTVASPAGEVVSDSQFAVVPAPPPSPRVRFKLDPVDRTGRAEVGSSVALDATGSTAVVNGNIDDGQVGAVWVFEANDAGALMQAGPKLRPAGVNEPIAHGRSVAVSADGTVVAAGAIYDVGYSGAVRVFARDEAGAWEQRGDRLFGDGGVSAQQGTAVALSADGTVLLEGGPVFSFRRGAAWLFRCGESGCTQLGGTLGATPPAQDDNFGAALALSADGTTAVVGAPGGGEGAAWVFSIDGSTWRTVQRLSATSGFPSGRFGAGVAVTADGQRIAVLAPGRGTGGEVCFFERTTVDHWEIQPQVLSGAGVSFGGAMAMSLDGTRLALTRNSSTGSAVLFTLDGGTWGNAAGFPGPNIAAGSQFSSAAFSLDGRVLLFGAAGDDGPNGAAWLFRPE